MGDRFRWHLWDWGIDRDGALRPHRIYASIPLLIRRFSMAFKWRTAS
jgi:hypothetical protein